ncbi:hypothetical protein RBB50_006798 [Rhinocladiella similis]
MSLMGKIPGLKSLNTGHPHPMTAHLSQGYDIGVVAVFESLESVKGYGRHPEDLKVKEMGDALHTPEVLAYDLEF